LFVGSRHHKVRVSLWTSECREDKMEITLPACGGGSCSGVVAMPGRLPHHHGHWNGGIAYSFRDGIAHRTLTPSGLLAF
jgi:hypothetical protein